MLAALPLLPEWVVARPVQRSRQISKIVRRCRAPKRPTHLPVAIASSSAIDFGYAPRVEGLFVDDEFGCADFEEGLHFGNLAAHLCGFIRGRLPSFLARSVAKPVGQVLLELAPERGTCARLQRASSG